MLSLGTLPVKRRREKVTREKKVRIRKITRAHLTKVKATA
jgi:hypothetical protein